MREVVLQIPTLEAEQNIDIDVKINGKKRTLRYRVEIIDWEDYNGKTADKVEVIKKVIKDGGIFVCSGILEDNEDLIVVKMKDVGFEIIRIAGKEKWVAICGRLKA